MNNLWYYQRVQLRPTSWATPTHTGLQLLKTVGFMQQHKFSLQDNGLHNPQSDKSIDLDN